MTDMKEENFQVLVWKTKVVKKLEVTELISEYWEEQPERERTHVIVDSPLLIKNRENRKLIKQMENLSLNNGNEKVDMYLQKVCDAGVIKKGDELWTSREYVSRKDGKHSKKRVNNGCKVTEIANGKLTVILVGYDEELKEIFSLNMLEEWLLDKFGLDEEYRPKDYHDCNEKIKIKVKGNG